LPEKICVAEPRFCWGFWLFVVFFDGEDVVVCVVDVVICSALFEG
jgi:hypothetical protein